MRRALSLSLLALGFFLAPMAGFAAAGGGPTPDAEGFISLFNGQNIDEWAGFDKFWSAENGVLTGKTTKENPTPRNTFLVWKGGLVDDFVMRFSYRIVADNDKGFANSGVQYRSKVLVVTNFVVGGYQADIEAGPTYSGILYDEAGVAGGRGIMAERGEKVLWDRENNKKVVEKFADSAELQKAIKPGDWNEYEITAVGYHFVHKINGKTMVDVTDESFEKRQLAGIIALQLHAGEPMTVQFKDLKLKKLPRDRKIVLVAGAPSHGPGEHEHRAGCLLLQKCLDQIPGIKTVVVSNGWPENVQIFEDAAAIVCYSDGGGGHPFIQGDRLQYLNKLMRRGMGLGCLHYAVEVPKDRGGVEFMAWIGGYFETFHSVNPHWDGDFKSLPKHPIGRGVKPFKIRDEWYYHMRFLEGNRTLTPILSAVPPDETRGKPGANDPHGGNPEVQKHMGEAEHTMWSIQRPDGGRGFGFTGGHFHKNWGNEDFRKVVLNAILWIAKMDVPNDGAGSTLAPNDLGANLDPKGR